PTVSQIPLMIARYLDIQRIQSGQGHRRMYFVELGIHTQLLNVIRGVEAKTAHAYEPGRQFGIVGSDVTSLETIEQFAGMQRETFSPGKATDLAPGTGFVDRFNSVHEQRHTTLISQGFQPGCIAAVHDWMYTKNKRRLFSQMRPYRVSTQR